MQSDVIASLVHVATGRVGDLFGLGPLGLLRLPRGDATQDVAHGFLSRATYLVAVCGPWVGRGHG